MKEAVPPIPPTIVDLIAMEKAVADVRVGLVNVETVAWWHKRILKALLLGELSGIYARDVP